MQFTPLAQVEGRWTTGSCPMHTSTVRASWIDHARSVYADVLVVVGDDYDFSSTPRWRQKTQQQAWDGGHDQRHVPSTEL